MQEERSVQSEVSGYISNLLRQHFGKGPTSVYVTIKRPYVTIHFRGFVSPMEKILLDQDEWKRVLETRDFMFNALKSEILNELLNFTQLEFTELYADWNLVHKTGMFIGVIGKESPTVAYGWPASSQQESFHALIEQVNEQAERKPDLIETFWLSNRTLLVKRSGILVGIERALIENGYMEILKLTKRPLEQQLLNEAPLSKALGREIIETFMDWNFEQDLGYIVFVLKSEMR
ncbi:Na-translocating system protein MpsC family protein [Planococcus alpniumensis]|uniref:Na-translocating system protein MpsC family protein n=1 Tax=Planococcus alpniumensis TaxID=2708345 RepID=UPI001B8B7EBE|nr:Na-translocating system protein MpsC family protein [Planococcus sp. MSAK28401]